MTCIYFCFVPLYSGKRAQNLLIMLIKFHIKEFYTGLLKIGPVIFKLPYPILTDHLDPSSKTPWPPLPPISKVPTLVKWDVVLLIFALKPMNSGKSKHNLLEYKISYSYSNFFSKRSPNLGKRTVTWKSKVLSGGHLLLIWLVRIWWKWFRIRCRLRLIESGNDSGQKSQKW